MTDMTNTFCIIPQRGNTKLTNKTIFSLKGQLPKENILVIDNGTSPEELDTFAHRPVYGMPDQNIHEMWNRGSDLIGSDQWLGEEWYIVYSNNDVIWGRDSIAKLRQSLIDHPELLAVCPNYDGRISDKAHIITDQICAARYDGTGGFAGFGFMIRGSEGIRFPAWLTWWCGDNWLIETAKDRDLFCAIIPSATLTHVQGGSKTMGPGVPEPRAHPLGQTISTDLVAWDLYINGKTIMHRYRGGRTGDYGLEY